MSRRTAKDGRFASGIHCLSGCMACLREYLTGMARGLAPGSRPKDSLDGLTNGDLT